VSKTKTTHENQAQRPTDEVRSSTTFVLDKNLGLPIHQKPWGEVLSEAGIVAEASTDLVHIDQLLADHGPDMAYVPGADFCIMIRKGNHSYCGLAIATSKFTGLPTQRTLLVVRKDDPANSIEDLAGADYGYMNKSCTSSYFPPAIILNRQGKRLDEFFKIREVPGWQNRVDAVVSKDIRATMILEDVWKTTPKNVEDTKIIGQFDRCPPSIVIIRHNLDEKLSHLLLEKLLAWMPDWKDVYGAFRPYYYADVQTFSHYLNELPADMM
jgi:phosphonate transport system substrate-binding protein